VNGLSNKNDGKDRIKTEMRSQYRIEMDDIVQVNLVTAKFAYGVGNHRDSYKLIFSQKFLSPLGGG
jgi:hypothetical protein